MEERTVATDPPVSLRVSTWSLVRAVAIVVAALVLLRVLVAASTVLWWLAIATVIAGAFHPAVTFLRRWMPGWAAILAVLAGTLGLAGFIGYRGVAELTAQFEVVRSSALETARSIQSSRQFGQVATEFGLVDKTTRFFENLPVVLGGGGGEGGAATAVQTAASSGSALFAIASFAILMLIFGARFVQAGLDQIDDPAVRNRVARLVVSSYHDSSRYVWFMSARALVVGLAGALLSIALDFEAPTAIGVGFAIVSVIPGIGLLVASLPLAVYLSIGSIPTGVLVLVAAVAVQVLDATIVQQRIENASVHVGLAPTLVAALVGLQLYGFGGLLVGLATAVYVLAVLGHLTHAHDEVYSAVRQLVGETPAEPDTGGAGVRP